MALHPTSPRSSRHRQLATQHLVGGRASVTTRRKGYTVATADLRNHYVRRLRFAHRGDLFEESTFATEAELAGAIEHQLELGIGPGEQPLPTAGPLFAQLEEGETDGSDPSR